MAETDDRAPAEDALDLRDRARPVPATPPVIDVASREAPVVEAPGRADIEAIDSSLVGEGGLPAASLSAPSRAEAEAEMPRHVDADASPTAIPVPADAPDPGPTHAGEGPPPHIAPPPVPARRGGFWPLFLGGVVAAGLGSAATIWALPNLRPQPEAPAAPVIDEAALRADAVSAAQAEVAARTEALLADARAAGTEAGTEAGAEAGIEAARNAIAEAAAAAPGEADSAAELEAAEQLQSSLAAIDELSRRVAALESRPAAMPTEDATGPAPASADEVAALRDELAAQAQQLQTLAARPQADPAALDEVRALADSAAGAQQQIEAAAAAVEQRLAAAETDAAAVEQQVTETARRTEALAALATLQSALDTGEDRSAAVEALATAGVEAPEALAVPAPSLEQLQETFPDAARAGLRASLRETPAGTGNTLTNFFRAQTGARSVEPRQGGDPDAVLSRAGDAVARGEIGAALAELEALPAAGREAMADWLQGAEAWAAAAAALGQVQDNLK